MAGQSIGRQCELAFSARLVGHLLETYLAKKRPSTSSSATLLPLTGHILPRLFLRHHTISLKILLHSRTYFRLLRL
jgi:hypothetical protein